MHRLNRSVASRYRFVATIAVKTTGENGGLNVAGHPAAPQPSGPSLMRIRHLSGEPGQPDRRPRTRARPGCAASTEQPAPPSPVEPDNATPGPFQDTCVMIGASQLDTGRSTHKAKTDRPPGTRCGSIPTATLEAAARPDPAARRPEGVRGRKGQRLGQVRPRPGSMPTRSGWRTDGARLLAR